MKVCWATKPYDVVGNGYGYSFHNRMMYENTAKHGIEYDDTAKIAVQITSADKFVPIEGKFNVLFSMWEFDHLPESYVKAINGADALIVPSTFVRDLFKRYTTKPVYVCREGIEPKDFPYTKRKVGSEKFRYLWVGASNPRKGYQTVLEAVQLCDQCPDMEVYIKTTMPNVGFMETIRLTIKNFWNIFFDKKDGKVRMVSLLRAWRRIPKKILANRVTVMGKNKNIVFDTRNLTRKELLNLYLSAHCFLLPSWGEGWGLTLCEAMATGCPSIATSITGHADFFDDEVGYAVKSEKVKIVLDNYDNLATTCNRPDSKDFILKMLEVAKDYPDALKKAKKGSERIHRKLTWDISGQRMAEILKELGKNADKT